ncbi:hypothetical protein DID76_01205 [Candidatus Marinamargulisbacteria bacterium SCGC AG-414-C22]|nr:hypothetical protein DID76_01205 [Candidatus Marinamargulisbacteria bacterium SCGC AG-414-C22]
MKKLSLIILIGILVMHVTANEIKLRTNLLANLISIYNVGVEFSLTEKYSLEGHIWNWNLSTDEDFEGSSLTKYGILLRAYNKQKNAYLGVGYSILSYSEGDVQDTSDSEPYFDIKIGQDFPVSDDDKITLGYSFGKMINSTGEGLTNVGFNLTYKL